MAKRKFVAPVLAELRATIQEAENLSAKPELTKAEESRINVLLAKIATLRAAPATEPGKYSESTRRWFRAFLRGKSVPEARSTQMLAGQQSITAPEGTEGGYLVPIEYEEEVIYGMAQFDPYLDEDVVTLLTDSNLRARPMKIRGWDLSTIAATKTGEGNQKTPITVPPVAGAILNGYTYKLSVAASFELEDDADADFLADQIETAFQIGFARGIGADLATGSGIGAPQGVLTGAVDSGVQLDPTITNDVSDTLNDAFQNAYFSVNRVYRASPNCAWAMNDVTYQWIRKLSDKQGRPLLNIKKDKETLMGKPVLISPTIPSFQSSVSDGKILFGDFSHYVVRVSQLRIQRALQAAGYVDKGLALYTAQMRADAIVFDPTGGNTPPIVSITVEP